MGCGTFNKASTPNCNTPFQGGNKSRIAIMEKDDYDAGTKTFDVTGNLSTLALPSGKTAWPYSGYQATSTKPSWKMVPADSGQPMYEHSVEYFVFDYSQSMKNALQKKAFGRYVVIHENAVADVNAFEVSGVGVGLKVVELTRGTQDNSGAFKLILRTPSDSKELEAALPVTFLSTDYPGTLTALNTLCALPTITVVAPLAAAAAGATALTFTGTNFWGGGTNSAVTRVEYVNQVTGALVNQVVYTVASNTSITCSSVAMAAGTYKVRITTFKGVAEDSVSNLIVT